ncbi:hypothetical protein ACC734_39175, partial [Rhizobium ruizarguesonis]
LSMLDGKAVGLDSCRDMGISMFAGEAEGRLDMLLRDAAAGELKPLYNFMNDLPGSGVRMKNSMTSSGSYSWMIVMSRRIDSG